MSLAILEGLACGTPVLGTPGGGTPELVGAVDPDLVLGEDSPNALAEALRRLCGEEHRLACLGRRARALAVERYDWDRVVDRLLEVCAEVWAGT
jgi:glycosyltransferase involved in cell wall biosynthesis